jgi:putative MFS transporter
VNAHAIPESLGGATDIGARLDRLPVTRFHRRLFAQLGAGLFVDGFDVYLAAGVAGALVKAGQASLDQIAVLISLTFVGLALGGAGAGFFADRFGRRRALFLTLGIVIIGSLGAAFSNGFQQLVAWRAATALGLGGETVLAYAAMTEFIPPSARGRAAGGLGLLANLGTPAALALGAVLLPQHDGWRWMLAAPGVAAIIVLYLRRNLPESPRWQAAHGKGADAERTLARLESSTTVASAPPPAPIAPAALPVRTRLRDLFASADYRRRLFVGAVLNAAIMLAVFGLVNWLPTFFVKQGFDVAKSLGFAAVMALGAPVGVALSIPIIDRLERRTGIVIFSMVAALGAAAYGFARSPTEILALGALMVTLIYLVGSLAMTGYVPELFPTGARMRATALCITFGRIVAMLAPFLIVAMFKTAGQPGVVGLVGAGLVIQALVVALWGPRTNNRALESLVAGQEAAQAKRIRVALKDAAVFARAVEAASSQPLYAAPPSIETVREGYAAFAAGPLARRVPDGVREETIDLDGVPGLKFTPAGPAPRPAVLFLHGGGMISGGAREDAGVAAWFAQALNAEVWSIDYRLAPEHPFPAAYDDACAALKALRAQHRGPLFVAGISVGGGLALGAALALRDTGAGRVDGVIASSAIFDMSLTSPRWRGPAMRDLIKPATAPFLYGLYLQGADARDPRASQIYADLKSAPPLMIIAGGEEYPLGDAELLAARAKKAGVAMRFEAVEAMPHGFMKFAGAVGDDAFRRVGAWVRSAG